MIVPIFLNHMPNVSNTCNYQRNLKLLEYIIVLIIFRSPQHWCNLYYNTNLTIVAFGQCFSFYMWMNLNLCSSIVCNSSLRQLILSGFIVATIELTRRHVSWERDLSKGKRMKEMRSHRFTLSSASVKISRSYISLSISL